MLISLLLTLEEAERDVVEEQKAFVGPSSAKVKFVALLFAFIRRREEKKH